MRNEVALAFASFAAAAVPAVPPVVTCISITHWGGPEFLVESLSKPELPMLDRLAPPERDAPESPLAQEPG
jgi:hypothetical protein